MKTTSNRTALVFGIILLSMPFLEACNSNKSVGNYEGRPFEDVVYNNGAQKVPGKLQCEYYDNGGEGVAFHDSDSINSGSGGLNKADGSYLHEFRIDEAVDISYTKFQNPPIDNNAYNFVDPEKDQLYVGWTDPGEWTKYTIDVGIEGAYKLDLMFTANQVGTISFSVNDMDVTGPISIPSTFVAEDTVGFRQWHHWNYIEDIAQIQLKEGIQTFTIHTVEIGSMNYDFIHFKLVE
jgi:hypothetical protein